MYTRICYLFLTASILLFIVFFFWLISLYFSPSSIVIDVVCFHSMRVTLKIAFHIVLQIYTHKSHNLHTHTHRQTHSLHGNEFSLAFCIYFTQHFPHEGVREKPGFSQYFYYVICCCMKICSLNECWLHSRFVVVVVCVGGGGICRLKLGGQLYPFLLLPASCHKGCKHLISMCVANGKTKC